ncbi:MAG: hypothetical protein ACXVBO_19715, partial [Isosphaeraceae bacterium]
MSFRKRPEASGCAANRDGLRLDRRGFLKAGTIGTAGLGLGQLLRLEAQGAGPGAGVTGDRPA